MIWENADGQTFDEADYEIRDCETCKGAGCDTCAGGGSMAYLREQATGEE